ncbi:hypothetical protein Tco_1516382 [Tanacetum coccineum]
MMTRIAIRKKIICLLSTFLHKKPKPHPQEVEEIKEKEDKVSSQIPIATIVMPIRITFDNLIDFNDHFFKPKDLKKDLTVAFDSTKSSILLPPLLDSDSPFTVELSASFTLNSLGNEEKVFKPCILVYHDIHDKNLVTLEKNFRENISSGTLLFLNKPSSPRPPPEPPDVEKCLEPEAASGFLCFLCACSLRASSCCVCFVREIPKSSQPLKLSCASLHSSQPSNLFSTNEKHRIAKVAWHHVTREVSGGEGLVLLCLKELHRLLEVDFDFVGVDFSVDFLT